ncbi:MAG: J domain-containing protein, partial [Phycisphaerae bacterium]|nr:J domain-containing protein [Phycisphaerae bacterium]
GRSRRKPKRSSRASQTPAPVAESHITLEFMQAVKGCTTALQLRRPDGKTEKINVKIPPGVREGSRIRLRGKADPGDLYIITHVRDHPYFRRDRADIYLDLPVSITEAALGAKVTVPTIDGDAVVKIPPGTAGRTRLRLRGKGVADPKTGNRGDQYAVIKIVLPKKISEKGLGLLDEFSRSDPYDPREKTPW